MKKILLLIAHGFGTGRIPVAPGTFGSMLGLGWFALLLWPGRLPIFALGTVVGILASVWICGWAERQLRCKDPSSVVLDEIVAMPICFSGWLCNHIATHHALPTAAQFFREGTWLLTAGIFLLFRLFDIFKPWPIRQSQSLPGGWGVTVDDVLAALYTAVLGGILSRFFL